MRECYDRSMQKWNRRWFLASLAATCAADNKGKARVFPSAAIRYLDPATEFPVIRLTDPQYTSSLPVAGNRGVAARSLLYVSDLAGASQVFWMDLRSKESRQWTEARQLDPASIALAPKDKGFWHFDGLSLIETTLPNLKPREVYRVPDGFEKLPGVSFADDGQYAAFIEKGAGSFRLRLLHLLNGTASTLVYGNAGQFWTVDFDGRQSRRLPLAEGATLQVDWAADGRELQYLNRPLDSRRLTGLRVWTPETDADAGIAETTQFLQFDSNADSSVFVGASGSKASPYLLLLIRAARRELTLAEHRATDPALVNPRFAPNSQFVVFVSDRHGKPAIYWIALDKLVADTGSSA